MRFCDVPAFNGEPGRDKFVSGIYEIVIYLEQSVKEIKVNHFFSLFFGIKKEVPGNPRQLLQAVLNTSFGG
jgi:hypothetical protein